MVELISFKINTLFSRVLCETIKEFASRILEASFHIGDEILENKCAVLEEKLDSLLQTLNYDDNFVEMAQDDGKFIPGDNLSINTTNLEKGVLEKPEKDITNLKRVRKNRNPGERDAVMARANSLKRAIRQLVEQTELVIDKQKNSSGNLTNKLSNLAINSKDYDQASNSWNTCQDKSININSNTLKPCESNASIIVSSASSFDVSSCPSPTPNLVSLSPMPDLRRDSQVDELLTLPAPDGFADSRRNSSNIPKE